MGSSIVEQKHKHCDSKKVELPSSSDNVKHIINELELIPSETEITKAGVLDGARIAWADKLNVPESSISDQPMNVVHLRQRSSFYEKIKY